ncbi:LOW QUALITY PROTEIN: NMDA receptor synaptonuclear signaling and neuronal migration factor [Xyrichtys novacula]|uniref:LOW QUALITY PROTEIN: NMDA receptor synaptonuclear signaling and neuronal migration factor n=1 Tax=Xyrichtys novacula TaxID=13765 RepID=A0AAV1GFF2_XYRNO|nr:LOW QUALITY PROTEIN: NMDA receptor synaptonuclear signaling and neuronal migration factor [Xyrichtys novacula]
MGTAVSKRKNLRNDAISSVAAKVRAARAFGEYLSHTHPENRNGSAHLLCETLVGPDPESPSDKIGPNNNNHLHPTSNTTKGCENNHEPSPVKPPLGLLQPPPPSITISTKPPRLSLERSFSAEEDQQKSVECTLQPARVYTITTQRGMLMSSGRGSKESLELDVLKEKSGSGRLGSKGGLVQPSTSPSSTSSSPTQYHHASGRGTSSNSGSHHHGNHHGNHHHHGGISGTNAPSSSGGASGSSSSNQQQQQSLNITGSHHHVSHHHHHHLSQPPLQTSVSAHNIRSWGEGGKGEAECSGLACDSCSGAPSRSQGSLDLESTSREAGKQHRRLERMWSVDRMTGLEREDTNWFPKENMFSFQTATTTMQAAFRGFVQRKRRVREQDSAEVIQRNFRKHLRMVGSRRIKAQTFAERRSKSFSRSWSDPTPVKTDSEPKDSGDLQASCGTLDEGGVDDNVDWEEEREMERLACEGDDFVPPKIMLISSKVPKAEYVPTIIRRDDPSIIPILYDHEHATFDDILEEIEKKLTAYRRGSKFWRMLIFCQGGPGHLYLLKNKVATFAKVEKEEDMSQFWRRLSRFMSKVNPEPNLIHIMGCYVLGNPNGEKLFQKLKNLMRPYSVEFESPLELSAQGKEMIEMYFDFRLYRLWKTRQHSKLLDYEDFL